MLCTSQCGYEAFLLRRGFLVCGDRRRQGCYGPTNACGGGSSHPDKAEWSRQAIRDADEQRFVAPGGRQQSPRHARGASSASDQFIHPNNKRYIVSTVRHARKRAGTVMVDRAPFLRCTTPVGDLVFVGGTGRRISARKAAEEAPGLQAACRQPNKRAGSSGSETHARARSHPG